MMKKSIVHIFLVVVLFFCSAAIVEAGEFVQLADSGKLSLGLDKAWSRTYTSGKDKIKVQFRNLMLASSKSRYHLIVWWNGKRIADGYCPEVRGGYQIKVFQNGSDKRIFISLNTQYRSVLLGYEPEVNKLHKYVDSKDFATNAPIPTMAINMRTKDIMLLFTGAGRNASNPVKYRLLWDSKAKWFGYSDETVYYTETDEEEDDEPEYYGGEETVTPTPAVGSNNGAQEFEEAEVVTGSSADGELFYEESEIVVGK
ncbi:MAG: hypothetical protein Q4E68_13200 [Prevotellaceae bacterium]|nr:hypothetical protein [Prevotellaceae bacterium]